MAKKILSWVSRYSKAIVLWVIVLSCLSFNNLYRKAPKLHILDLNQSHYFHNLLIQPLHVVGNAYHYFCESTDNITLKKQNFARLVENILPEIIGIGSTDILFGSQSKISVTLILRQLPNFYSLAKYILYHQMKFHLN